VTQLVAVVRHRFEISRNTRYKVTLNDTQGELGASRVVVTEGRMQRLQAIRNRTDLEMTLITGAIAIGSGMLALYLSKSAWGSSADYLGGLLWGTTVSQGIKYVDSLVKKILPQIGG